MGRPSGVQCDLRCNRQENSFIASQKSRPQLDIASLGARSFRHSLTEGSQATGFLETGICEVTDEIPDGWSANRKLSDGRHSNFGLGLRSKPIGMSECPHNC